jgi:hypothetical protein
MSVQGNRGKDMQHEQPILSDWRYLWGGTLGAVLFPNSTRVASLARLAMPALWKAQRLRTRAVPVLSAPDATLSSYLSRFKFLLPFLWHFSDPRCCALCM